MMTPRDFHIWQRLQVEIQNELRAQGKYAEAEEVNIQEDMEEEVFEAVSKRAWTDILLQILKVSNISFINPTLGKFILSPLEKRQGVLPRARTSDHLT
jgi:hypothetical protein